MQRNINMDGETDQGGVKRLQTECKFVSLSYVQRNIGNTDRLEKQMRVEIRVSEASETECKCHRV